NMSLTFTLTDKSSVLTVSYFLAVDLSDGDYEFGLTDFEMYGNNCLAFLFDEIQYEFKIFTWWSRYQEEL
ncbi:hypothetical protein ALC56_03610, partial [Trachymyrmex septentrionalis]